MFQNINRLVILILVYSFPGVVVSADIWALAAYRACLESAATPMTRYAVPYEFQSIKNLNAPECNRLIILYRAALAVENVSDDRCITHRSGRISTSSKPYVIAVADGVLEKCKSNMIGSTISIENIDELKMYAKSIYPENDDLARRHVQGWHNLISRKREEMTHLARRNKIDHLGWWISSGKVDGEYRYEEYNLSLVED